MVACGDSSSSDSGFSVPEYRNEAALPDSCEMEVAKAGDTYFACFENKWIEVTDSATVEQLKEGLNENEIKEKLEELEDLLKPSAPVKPKSSNSEGSDEDVESSDSEEPESSSDEEECTGRSCKDSSSSGKQQGDDDANKCGGETYDPATQYCQNGTTIADLATCGTAKYNPEERYCTKDGDVANLATCGTVKYNPEEKFCADETYGIVADLCGGQSYHAGEFEVCVNGTVKQYECCGYDGTNFEAYMACIQDVDAGTFEHLYDPTTQYCQNGTTVADLATCGTARYEPEEKYCTKNGEVANLATCGTVKYNPEEKFCADETYSIVADLCGGQSYHGFEVCVNGTVKQYECCGYDGTNFEAYMACIQDLDAGTFEHLYDPTTQYCQNGTTIADLATCGTARYNPATQYCQNGTTVADLATCGTVKYNPEEKFCADETYGIVADLCGGQSYHAGEFEVCVNGTVKQYECCGYDGTNFEAYMACIQDVDAGTFEHLYDPTTQYCQNGTTIGNLVSCGTYDPATQFCDSRAPGNIYKYVTIGSQTWMAENLNFEAIEGSYCYDEISANCAAYGRLYTWAAAVGKSEEECGYGKRCNFTDIVQGVCPEGWHLPSDNEWQTLLTAVNSAAKLKANTGWSNDGNGTDDYGFAVKPAGYMSGWYYAGETENASFWTSTADGVTDGYRVLFSYESNDAEVWYKDKGLGYSVRCIKNAN